MFCRSLILAGNPITSLTNTSLLGAADTLEELDIAHFHLNTLEVVIIPANLLFHYIFLIHFQNGALSKLNSLRSLRISTYPNLHNFNIPRILEHCANIRNLWIEAPISVSVDDSIHTAAPAPVIGTDLRREMDGFLPHKLGNITISGSEFNTLSDNIFKVVLNRKDNLNFYI